MQRFIALLLLGAIFVLAVALHFNRLNKCGLEPAHAPASLTPDPLQETSVHPLQRIRSHYNHRKASRWTGQGS